jgi:hypothetical protein
MSKKYKFLLNAVEGHSRHIAPERRGYEFIRFLLLFAAKRQWFLTVLHSKILL